jgi:hypothetical protein
MRDILLTSFNSYFVARNNLSWRVLSSSFASLMLIHRRQRAAIVESVLAQFLSASIDSCGRKSVELYDAACLTESYGVIERQILVETQWTNDQSIRRARLQRRNVSHSIACRPAVAIPTAIQFGRRHGSLV